jgi:hypothetical protein
MPIKVTRPLLRRMVGRTASVPFSETSGTIPPTSIPLGGLSTDRSVAPSRFCEDHHTEAVRTSNPSFAVIAALRGLQQLLAKTFRPSLIGVNAARSAKPFNLTLEVIQ